MAQVLIVGGGGSSSTGGTAQEGGGGAGGYYYTSSFTLSPQTYTVTVGAGGAPGYGGASIFYYTIAGGGFGGYTTNAGNGGGGGGGVIGYAPGTGSYGYGGGNGNANVNYSAGGGGGAGSVGGDGGIDLGARGAGVVNNISGFNVTYSQGGQGGTASTSITLVPANKGYGADGGAWVSGSGVGGSGIVIVRWTTSDFGTPTITGTGNTLNTTTVAGDTIATFIVSGDLTISPLPPTVTTQAVSDIVTTTATGNGNITDTGGATVTAWGVCYNTTGTPTTADIVVAGSGTGAVGAFTASMTGLTAGQTYYVRAYATNSAGTSYGADVTFTISTANSDFFRFF